MASDKRVGSPDHADDASLPPQKRLKEETDDKSAVPRETESAAVDNPEHGHNSPANLKAAPVNPETTGSKQGNMDTELANAIREPIKSQVDVDLIVCSLKNPDGGADVMRLHANELTAHKQVQAYAKLAGRGWTYYVQKLEIVIGRSAADSKEMVDIDLAPSKIVSRRHAVIRYNLTSRTWEIITFGRNGLRLDNNLLRSGVTANLSSGSVVDVGNMQMMFVLPDAEPIVAPIFIEKVQEFQRTNKRSLNLLNSNGSAVAEPQPAYPNGVTIVSRPQVPSMDFFVQELSNDECKDIKPPFSYATMIAQAILSTSEHKMTLADIYSWISGHYAFYRHSKPGWQNSIRHNLSLNKAFEKAPRKENESGKGSKWYIVEHYKEELIRKATTGRPHKGAYIPRKPYEDSPSPHGRQVAGESQGSATDQKVPVGVVPSGAISGNGSIPGIIHGSSHVSGASGHTDPSTGQPGQQASSSFPGNVQMVSQQNFPGMPMGYQQMNGNFPGMPYMSPYGVPYYPQQPGQTMLPVVPPMSAQLGPGQSQHQSPVQSQASHLSNQIPNHHQISVFHHESTNQKQDPTHQQQQPRGPTPTGSKTNSNETLQSQNQSQSRQSPQSQQAQLQEQHAEGLQAGVQLASERAHPVLHNAEQNPLVNVNSELKTPARQAKQYGTRNRDSNGEPSNSDSFALGSAIKQMPAPESAPPESSPALWKYMNLESTPNNQLRIQKPGEDPNSSPPGPVQGHSERRENVNEPIPLIEKWERGKA